MTTIHKYRKALLLAVLIGLPFYYNATAQRVDNTARLSPYTGVYVLPSGVQLVVEIQDDDLAVRPLGKPTPETDSAMHHAFNRKADVILAGLARNDTAPLRAAMPVHRRDRAADLERLFTLFAQGHGALKSYRVMGTVPRGTDRAWTFAHVTFEKGTEVLRLTWKDDQLATIQRGAYPDPAFQHEASARFESATGRNKITFNLRADGAVESMTITGRHGAVTAYKLDEVTALN